MGVAAGVLVDVLVLYPVGVSGKSQLTFARTGGEFKLYVHPDGPKTELPGAQSSHMKVERSVAGQRAEAVVRRRLSCDVERR